MDVMDERESRATEQDKHQLTLLIQTLPLSDTPVMCVSFSGGMHDCDRVRLTDACVLC